MAEFDLKDLISISKSSEIIDLLVAKNIIKEKAFLKQLKYERELDKLQYELLRLQEQIITNGGRMLIIYEGRDAAGKGGTISRTISKLNPKNFRVVSLSKPTENESKQWYFQRYLQHLPKKGEIVLFDRSWYNRAVVEPVFGFCTEAEHESFMNQVNRLEHLLIDDGIVLIKFFLSISKKEQQKRLEARSKDKMKQYKIGPLDQQATEKWDDYSFYIGKMLSQTSTEKSPWIEVSSDSKKKVRIETMKYILSRAEDFETKIDVKKDKNIVKIRK